ncbi:Crp/Fnr family transcriptional regulator [Thalassotalea sp. 1_MG-2023]|uniref:Crp/Fnr family transcriptional regulator n=1 Tax=Thalassotalea sp. 1_MG-2023 TaxID=3062680 RepID=UPI0026E2453D|nr:Crp/Fnr family transcriptional regulator [Thalassotalea sp. 1_MG-2023]MDO6425976.1 Crp/Fnr family transcriptional regulator [Thalassotalea sp. 1_MG-2023]
MSSSINHLDISNILLRYSFPKVALATIIPMVKHLHISAGTIMLSPGKRWNDFMLISQGIFRLYYLNSEGKESNKGFFSEGQILAPIARSAIEKPALFFVEALTNVEVYQCKYDQLVAQLQQHHNGVNCLNGLTDTLLEDKIQREVMFLQLGARERYQQFINDFPNLHDRIPLRHLASYLGMTDVTLSRIRHKKN